MSEPPDLAEQFQEFFLREKNDLLAYAASRPHSGRTPEDLLQEAIKKAWKLLLKDNKYHDYNWFTWIISIIRYAALDDNKRRKKKPEVLANDLINDDGVTIIEKTASGTLSPAELAELNEQNSSRARSIAKALSTMEKIKERRCLELVYYENMSLKEVALNLGIKPVSVGQLHKRAKESLKKALLSIAPECTY